MIQYSEGPAKNWKAIHFPPGFTLKVSGVGSTVIEFATYDSQGDLTVIGDGAALQKIVTGKTSGATIDLRLVPVSTFVAFANGPFTPECLIQWVNLFSLDGSAAVAPTLGVNIVVQGFGSSTITLVAAQSYTYTTTPSPACSPDNNAPALPGFIVGEECTLADEA